MMFYVHVFPVSPAETIGPERFGGENVAAEANKWVTFGAR